MAAEDIGKTMTWFYVSPSEALFRDIALDLSGHPQASAHVEDIFAVFLWRSASKYEYAMPSEAFGPIVTKAKLLLDPASANRSEWAVSIHEPSALTPELLDLTWMSYFATGEVKYLDLILGAIRGQYNNSLAVVAAAAPWSFRANCEQHPSILAHAESRVESASDPLMARFLRDCIQRAKTKEAHSFEGKR